ncbi:MAG: winged helix-turn-helix transcriptional regulator [Promethearchaeota archaeon]
MDGYIIGNDFLQIFLFLTFSIIALYSGLLIFLNMVKIRRGIYATNVRGQKLGIRIKVVIIVAAVFLGFITVSIRRDDYQVHVERIYGDYNRDYPVLESIEDFNPRGVNDSLDLGSEIFPARNYSNKTEFFPFCIILGRGNQHITINYRAYIEFPDSDMNLPALMLDKFPYLDTNDLDFNVAHVMVNSTWILMPVSLEANVTIKVGWIAVIHCVINLDVRDYIFGTDLEGNVILMIRVQTAPVGTGDAMEATSLIGEFGASWLPFLIPVMAFIILSALSINSLMSSMARDRRLVTIQNYMENRTRQRILRIIRDNPGINFSAIKRHVAVSPRTLLHHLSILLKYKQIRLVNFGNKTIYFDSSITNDLNSFYFHVNDKRAKDLLALLVWNPDISLTEALRILKIPRSTLSRKIKRLAKAGILNVIYESNRLVSISISNKFQEHVINFLQRAYR